MSTKRLVVFRFVCHCEGGWNALLIRRFLLTFFVNGTVTSQSSTQQGQKWSVRGAGDIDLIVSDNFVYWDAWLCALTQSIIIAITLLEHLNKGKTNWWWIRGNHQNSSLFAICLACWRRPNRFGKWSVFCQPCYSP